MFERVHWVIQDDGTLYLFDDDVYANITLQYYKKDTVLYARILDHDLIVFDNQADELVLEKFKQKYSSHKIYQMYKNNNWEFCAGGNTGDGTDRLLYVQRSNTVFSLLCDNYDSGITAKKIDGEWRFALGYKVLGVLNSLEEALEAGKSLFKEYYESKNGDGGV
jgi:hypothetical protein